MLSVTERQLTTIFSKYLKSHPRSCTECYELKMVKGQSFALKSVQPHQVLGLQTSLEALGYKISDSPIYAGSKNRFTFKKPFDYVYIKASNAYVVPIFYKPRTYKKAFLIPVQEFVKFTGTSIKMSELETRGFENFYL